MKLRIFRPFSDECREAPTPKGPEPKTPEPMIKTYDLDALLRKLGAQKDSEYFLEQNGCKANEWRCAYCDHVNTTEMLDCHYCNAPKPKLFRHTPSNDYCDDDSTKIELKL